MAISGLSRSCFYYHRLSLTKADKNEEIKQAVARLYHAHKGRYGYRRITASLAACGHVVNSKKVRRLMGLMGLKSLVRPKRYRSYRAQSNCSIPNLLARQFDAQMPNEKWVTDVTEFHVAGKKLYLSALLDLFNGEIIAYQMGEQASYELVSLMLKKALNRLSADEKPLLHSDQGLLYRLPYYQNILTEYGITQSMSRKGNCLDNAAMESFFATLKTELFYLHKFNHIEQLADDINDYIKYYNNQRIRLKLNHMSPVQYRKKYHLAA